jgi:hypothetical protein
MLRAICEGPVGGPTWFIDGMEYAVTGPPYEVAWQPDRGPHRVAVAATGVLGDSVQVVVE